MGAIIYTMFHYAIAWRDRKGFHIELFEHLKDAKFALKFKLHNSDSCELLSLSSATAIVGEAMMKSTIKRAMKKVPKVI